MVTVHLDVKIAAPFPLHLGYRRLRSPLDRKQLQNAVELNDQVTIQHWLQTQDNHDGRMFLLEQCGRHNRPGLATLTLDRHTQDGYPYHKALHELMVGICHGDHPELLSYMVDRPEIKNDPKLRSRLHTLVYLDGFVCGYRHVVRNPRVEAELGRLFSVPV